MAELASTERPPAFLAGAVVAAAAVLPPLDGAAEHHLAAHMVQHVLLLVVAAPLLAAGPPLTALAARLPGRQGKALAAAWGRALAVRARHWTAAVLAALVVQSGVMWAWHAPVLYDAAVAHEPLHALEHLSYLLTAVGFWWCTGLGSGRPRGGAVPVVFAAALPGSALGAALTLAGNSWYRLYPDLADQQMAGVIMWGFGGLAYVLVAAVLFGTWVAALERETPGRPLTAGVGR